MKNILLFVILSMGLQTASASELVIYDTPDNMEAAPEFNLEVDGRNVFVYNTRSAAFAYFSFEGEVNVKVTFTGPIYDYDIRPKRVVGSIWYGQ